MIDTNPNTYIQYLNKNGNVKSVEVDRQVEGSLIIYTTPKINEDFFVLGLFEKNLRVFGLTFMNVQNLDNIAFLNSDFQSVDAIPEISFNLANTEIAIVKDTQNYDINFSLPFNEKKLYTNEELFVTQFFNRLSEGDLGGVPINKTIQPFAHYVSDFEVDTVLFQSPIMKKLFYAKIDQNTGSNLKLKNKFTLTPEDYFEPKEGYNLFTAVDDSLGVGFQMTGYMVMIEFLDR